MTREKFRFRRVYLEYMRELNDSDKAVLLDAVVNYGLDGEEPHGLRKDMQSLFTIIRKQIDKDCSTKLIPVR